MHLLDNIKNFSSNKMITGSCLTTKGGHTNYSKTSLAATPLSENLTNQSYYTHYDIFSHRLNAL